jgi:uncharacterized protein YbjT (DUF2867 family)
MPSESRSALDGVEQLYLLAPFEPRLVELERNVLDAACRVGVRHVVKHSGLGASPDSLIAIGRWHGEAQRQLERSGLAFTHLQPHSFMQNLLGSAQTIAAEGILYAPMGDARVSLVDARDIAAVAARVLLEPRSCGADVCHHRPPGTDVPRDGRQAVGGDRRLSLAKIPPAEQVVDLSS